MQHWIYRQINIVHQPCQIMGIRPIKIQDPLLFQLSHYLLSWIRSRENNQLPLHVLLACLFRYRVQSTWRSYIYIYTHIALALFRSIDPHKPRFLFSKMGHRKVYSQGSIPFSWEDQPGVCKVPHQECSIDRRLHALKLTSLQPPSTPAKLSAHDAIKIPLPPCPLQPPRRSTSKKQEEVDPFLVAYNECTKSSKSAKPSSQSKKAPFGSKLRKTKSIFSCKDSGEVIEEGNILKLSQLPSLPRYNIKYYGVSRRESRECLREHKPCIW